MQEENFSPEQSLSVIQSMIEKAKNAYSENGHLYLIWGWVVFLCSIAQFVLIKFVQYEKHYIVWFACWVVVIYQMYYLRKKGKQKKAYTYADRMMGYTWVSFFILMMLVGLAIGQSGEVNMQKLVGPLFLALYGMPTFLSGLLLRFKPLVIGGIGCWILSVTTLVIPYDYHLLLLAAAMVIAWIIPGYILQKQYQLQ